MLQDFIIALFSQLDVLSGAVIAINYQFLMLPSAFGYLAGAIGSLLTGSITPVSFMYENMVLSFSLAKRFPERIAMILAAALLTGILGVFGLPQLIVDHVGQDIFLAMMAGVGLYLAKVGFDLVRPDLLVGGTGLISAVLVQLLTNDLVKTVAVSVPLAVTVNYCFRQSRKAIVKKISFRSIWSRETRPIKLSFRRRLIPGVLALSTLTIGGNVAYTSANAQLASGQAFYNETTIISSVADLASSLFGGANMELIISPTAAAPNPLRSAVIFMLLAAVILGSGLIYRLARWVPVAATGGYLFVIGAILILPYNALDAFRLGNPLVAGTTLAVTFLTNPFYGLLAGLLVKIVL